MSQQTVVVEESPFTMSVQERLPLSFDVSALLEEGQSVATAVATLTNVTDRAVVSLVDDVAYEGSTISQFINGPDELVEGKTFRLQFLFNASPSNAFWLVVLVITPVA